MKNTFWMFAIMLMLITLISSMGGGIRYRENFVDEVLDINNDNTADAPQGYDYYPVHHPADDDGAEEVATITGKSVSFEDDTLKIEEEEVVEEEEEAIPDEEVAIALNTPPQEVPSNPVSTNEFIVPYGGEFYAPF